MTIECARPYTSFKYIPTWDDSTRSLTILDSSGSFIAHYRDLNNVAAEIYSDVVDFMDTRPEGFVYTYILAEQGLVPAVDWTPLSYAKLLGGICLIRAARNIDNPDDAITKVNRMLNWLKITDFYTAPASRFYHEAYTGGLMEHTFKVAKYAIELCQLPKFHNVSVLDAILVALVHDWCKIGRYEVYKKNQKCETTGKWEQVNAYRLKTPITPLGHGETSMYYAMRFINLSLGEACAVRWHMGEYKCVESEQNELETANQQYPLVYVLQFADRLACTQY